MTFTLQLQNSLKGEETNGALGSAMNVGKLVIVAGDA
jgi:hypothetical protein